MKKLFCLLGLHKRVGCKCSMCGEIKHDWNGCKCSMCGETKHEWNGCKCSACGEIKHEWNGCKCSVCGKDKPHNWNGCSCSVCGELAENKVAPRWHRSHRWDNGVCEFCGAKEEVYLPKCPECGEATSICHTHKIKITCVRCKAKLIFDEDIPVLVKDYEQKCEAEKKECEAKGSSFMESLSYDPYEIFDKIDIKDDSQLRNIEEEYHNIPASRVHERLEVALSFTRHPDFIKAFHSLSEDQCISNELKSMLKENVTLLGLDSVAHQVWSYFEAYFTYGSIVVPSVIAEGKSVDLVFTVWNFPSDVLSKWFVERYDGYLNFLEFVKRHTSLRSEIKGFFSSCIHC